MAPVDKATYSHQYVPGVTCAQNKAVEEPRRTVYESILTECREGT